MAVNTSSNIEGPHSVTTVPANNLLGPQALIAANLDVYGSDINGDLVQLTKDVHYTVNSVGDTSSVSVTANNGAVEVFIENVQPLTQTDDYVNTAKFDAPTAEQSWDKGILPQQFLRGLDDLAIRIRKNARASTAFLVIDDPTLNKEKVLQSNATTGQLDWISLISSTVNATTAINDHGLTSYETIANSTGDSDVTPTDNGIIHTAVITVTGSAGTRKFEILADNNRNGDICF